MARDLARRDQDRVEADVLDALVRIGGKPRFGGCGDALALRGVTEARFHFDEDEQRAPAGDNINFATGLFQRRATMRKPLPTSNAAAPLSAERPVRNAACRSGSASFGFGRRPGARK